MHFKLELMFKVPGEFYVLEVTVITNEIVDSSKTFNLTESPDASPRPAIPADDN